jgi:hypothetical protein
MCGKALPYRNGDPVILSLPDSRRSLESGRIINLKLGSERQSLSAHQAAEPPEEPGLNNGDGSESAIEQINQHV